VSFLRLIGRVAGSLLGLGFIGGSGRRVRGVIAQGVGRLAQGSGSAPARAGNTHTEESEHDHGNRITPARAGNTSGSGGDWRAPGAHPRSRGEYGERTDATWSMAGSPPLARGIPLLVCADGRETLSSDATSSTSVGGGSSLRCRP